MKNLGIIAALTLAGFVSDLPAQIRVIYRDIRVQKPAPKSTQKAALKVPSENSPKWNIEGSWRRAFNKEEVQQHLAEDHGLDILQINKFTINQLWTLHTWMHEGKAKPLAPLKKLKPQPQRLPPVQSSNT